MTIATKRNWLLKSGALDITRTSQVTLSCFREGKIGNFTIERPEDYELI